MCQTEEAEKGNDGMVGWRGGWLLFGFKDHTHILMMENYISGSKHLEENKKWTEMKQKKKQFLEEMRERPWFDFWWMRHQRNLKNQQHTSRERETADVIRRIKCYMEVGEVIWQWTSRTELYWTYTYSDQSHSLPPLKMNFEIIQKEKWNLKLIFWEMWKKKLHICVTSPYFQTKVTFKTRPECFCFASMFFWLGGDDGKGIIYIPTNQNSWSQGYAWLQIGE